jgi:hypothetical protein
MGINIFDTHKLSQCENPAENWLGKRERARVFVITA